MWRRSSLAVWRSTFKRLAKIRYWPCNLFTFHRWEKQYRTKLDYRASYMAGKRRDDPGVTSNTVPPKIVSPPLLHKRYARGIFQPLLVETVLLHRSLRLWIVYQRVLGFRSNYSTAVELLYIAIHVILNLYIYIYTDAWGHNLGGTQSDVTPATIPPRKGEVINPRRK